MLRVAERNYTADDGLELLFYLGYTEVPLEQKRVFRALWNEVYAGEGQQDLIETTGRIYAEELPFFGIGYDPFELSVKRTENFSRRLDLTGICQQLESGISLDAILATGPHIFFTFKRQKKKQPEQTYNPNLN